MKIGEIHAFLCAFYGGTVIELIDDATVGIIKPKGDMQMSIEVGRITYKDYIDLLDGSLTVSQWAKKYTNLPEELIQCASMYALASIDKEDVEYLWQGPLGDLAEVFEQYAHAYAKMFDKHIELNS